MTSIYFVIVPCPDDKVQCELCEEWLHMSREGFKTAREAFENKVRVPIVQKRNVFTYLRLYERLLVGVVTSFLFRNFLMLFNQKIRLSYFCDLTQ